MQEATPECVYVLAGANSDSRWELWRYAGDGSRLVASFNSRLVTKQQAEAACRLLMPPNAVLEVEKTEYSINR